MDVSRRDLALLLPALAVALQAQDQQQQPGLEGKIYKVDSLPWHVSANGSTRSKAVFNGTTGRGQHISMHITELAPGQRPHPAARQPHEEILIVQTGTLECSLNGQTAQLVPGDIVYSAYNDLKDWKNTSAGPAVYYVVSLEEHK